MRSINFRTLPFFLLLCSCANIIAPTGGEADTQAPNPIYSNPSNYTTHFSQNHIRITFDEFFQLNDEYNQILVSPPLTYPLKIKIKKKSIHLIIEDTLRENTTYTINFGESLSDITEGNTLENYQFVFSTGDYVDSLKLSGKTRYAETHENEKGILVMLYLNSSDSVVRTMKPFYFTRTNEDGDFEIRNIKAGYYKIFALKDQNLNYIWDLANEDIAFLDTLIEVSTDTNIIKVQLNIYQEDKSPQLLVQHQSRRAAKLKLRFSKPADSISIRPLNYIGYFGCITKTDTVHCWIDNVHLDSLAIEVINNVVILDTINFNIPSLPPDSNFSSKLKLNTNLATGTDVRIDLKQPFKLLLADPTKNFDASKIKLYEDSTEKIVQPWISWDDSLMRSLSIVYDWNAGTIYKLVIESGCFENIYNNSHDTSIFTFKARMPSEYGNLKLIISVNDSSQNYILQLLTTNRKISQQRLITQCTKSELNFDLLPPKKYSIRVIQDNNKNGKWDGGDYDKKLQPEQVYYYTDPINLRPNWDMDIEIKIPF